MEELERALLLQQFAGAAGIAILHCQELENALATYLVMRIQGRPGMGLEKGQALLEKANRKPMGPLIKALQEADVLSPSLEGRLLSILDERNWAAHRIARENRGILYKPALFDVVRDRLERLTAEALDLQKVVNRHVEEHLVAQGVNKAAVDIEAARILAQWHSNDLGEGAA